jgi:hypothetical protein
MEITLHALKMEKWFKELLFLGQLTADILMQHAGDQGLIRDVLTHGTLLQIRQVFF